MQVKQASYRGSGTFICFGGSSESSYICLVTTDMLMQTPCHLSGVYWNLLEKQDPKVSQGQIPAMFEYEKLQLLSKAKLTFMLPSSVPL